MNDAENVQSVDVGEDEAQGVEEVVEENEAQGAEEVVELIIDIAILNDETTGTVANNREDVENVRPTTSGGNGVGKKMKMRITVMQK